ncbi:MAG TPA: hypothetical protein VIH67_03860 [Candidatus Acidoferrum sp.]
MSKKLSLLLLVVVAVILISISLTSPLAGQSKSGKNKHLQKQSHLASKPKTSFQPLRMRRAETVPGISANGGEPDKGPTAFEEENYANRAYPAVDVPIEATASAKKQFQDIDDESEKGERGEKIRTSWTSLGPTVALYPAVLNRTGTPYVASGRITALAIEPKCRKEHCRLYVGAAGGGIWQTDNALSDKPKWNFISKSFATNAIGTITIDPTDPTGETIYVGTGEPNASVDSEAGMGIYKSTDGGDSWTLLSATAAIGTNTFINFPKGRAISEITIDPTNRSTIYVSTTRGVRGYSSVPGGATTNPPPPVAPFGLYKSTDGGNTFSFIWDGHGSIRGVNAVELDPKNPAIVYAAAYQRGIWRNSPADGGVFKQVFVPQSPAENVDQTAFALTVKDDHIRAYAGDGAVGPAPPPSTDQESQVWRNDNMDQPAAALVVGGTNQGGWKKLTSSTVSAPGFATYNYCTGQCWYDNRVYTPAGRPDTVFVLGSFLYTEAGGRSNGRAVLRSTTAGEPDPANNNRTFTDLTWDASSSTTPNGIHPDQHALAFVPGNPEIWFEGSDGGLMRSSGAYTDVSSQCGARGLSPASTLACRRLLSSVPTLLTSLNTGLDTLQFQSLSINPFRPTRELLGGTQDNGTFLYEGSSVLWPQTIFGDGGQSGFNAANPDIRFHTYFIQQVDVNFRGTDTLGWDWVSDPFFEAPVEGSAFYIPIIADPNPAKAGSMFAGLQGVWRTTDNGGPQATLDPHCNEFTGDFPPTVRCGDWVELGSLTGHNTPASDLTHPSRGNRAFGVVAAITRAPSDTGTLWVATSVGRVFVSKNADAVSTVSGADGSSVTFSRIDSLAVNSPGRFVSGIYVDPAKPNRAWISYSGYNMNTPAQPGHVFEVVYNPDAGTAVWTDLDGGTGPMGDLPVTALVRDDPTGDLYAATDFGVLRLPAGGTAWQTAGSGLPQVEVPGLSISTSARVLYAATHGRGAYVLGLPNVHDAAGHNARSGDGSN